MEKKESVQVRTQQLAVGSQALIPADTCVLQPVGSGALWGRAVYLLGQVFSSHWGVLWESMAGTHQEVWVPTGWPQLLFRLIQDLLFDLMDFSSPNSAGERVSWNSRLTNHRNVFNCAEHWTRCAVHHVTWLMKMNKKYSSCP